MATLRTTAGRVRRAPWRFWRRDPWLRDNVAAKHVQAAVKPLDDDSHVPHRLFRDAIEWTVENVELPERARFLDHGCGAGHYSVLLDRYAPGRFAYTGADISEAMIERARTLWPGREFLVDDLVSSALNLDSFDVVCASGVLVVLPEWERALHVLLASQAAAVIVHRQPLAAETTVTRMRHYSYRGWNVTLALHDIEAAAGRHGRKVGVVLAVPGETHSTLVLHLH